MTADATPVAAKPEPAAGFAVSSAAGEIPAASAPIAFPALGLRLIAPAADMCDDSGYCGPPATH
ncbi:hypothetical protein [Herbiconiux sp. L3-i23]|uniref:hypothetical protein n=1 Tax=Herbiconiux sp. L3-i23 TaxID=2905871 RepID=UPI00205F52CC|nr:hypothetical protein [Herbiconiux sp. L3-i23]BDI23038.1 hypothetical protein L3i23_18140 [Herbiconiux sp. L3-i23]